MAKKIGNVLAYITMTFGVIFGLAMLLSCILYIFTPHVTKYNQTTDIYRYWLSDTYFCENFNCPQK